MNLKTPRIFFIIAFLHIWLPSSIAQQVADQTIITKVDNPLYKTNKGPIIFIDEAHHNFHTYAGRFHPFAGLLEKDGYQIKSSKLKFTTDHLNKCKILVISNALNEEDKNGWVLPNPSAFTKEEIKIVKMWVEAGGRLLLIADHMPFPGAAYALAKAFGFEFSNGFALQNNDPGRPVSFTLENQGLHENEITKGRNENESIRKLLTFTGSAFKAPAKAKPIMTFQRGFTSLEPDTAWRFHPNTKKVAIEGWHQGAYMQLVKDVL